MIDDPQNAVVVERVKIVFSNSALASGLVVVNCFMRQADFGDHAAKVRVGVVKGTNPIHDAPVIQSKAGEVFKGFNRGEATDQAVVPFANPEHERIFFAGAFDGQNHRVAFFPSRQQIGDHLGRVLQVGHEENDCVPVCLQQPVHGRANVAKVASVHDDLDVRVICRERFSRATVASVEALSIKMCSYV